MIRGRGGRVIVVDEVQGEQLARALNRLAHRREHSATLPIDQVDLPAPTILDRFDAWGDRFLEWMATRGIYIAIGAVLGLVLMVVVASALMGVRS